MEDNNQPKEEFVDIEGFEELTANWVGLVTREEFVEHMRRQHRLAREQELESKGAAPMCFPELPHAPSSQGGEGMAAHGELDGWQESTSDEEEFNKLTQSYVYLDTAMLLEDAPREEGKNYLAPSVQGAEEPIVEGWLAGDQQRWGGVHLDDPELLRQLLL